MTHKLEIIGFNIESCIIAQAAGADRIELCDGPSEGGTTPSYGFIKAARSILHIELFPIIRPRGGDLLYSDAEYEIMISDIHLCKKLGCDGIVIGILSKDGTVDMERCKRVVDMAYPLGVTFHRAFDRTVDPFQALEDIIEIGCERILTSGQMPNALDGAGIIAELINIADDRIIIMPGSGIRSENIAAIAKKTNATEFHSSAKMMADSNMEFPKTSLTEKLIHATVNENEVREIKKLLTEL
ncbi:copper homeostasis protein CutC [soil metagenome]